MVLASGVTFDPVLHEYLYRGKKLSGITGVISNHLGKKFNEYTEEKRLEGVHIHSAIQKWIETGDSESVHPKVRWLTEKFLNRHPRSIYASEVLVSDFKKYASMVDIVVELADGYNVDIIDVKTGKMQRDSVTWQLSIYRYFIDKFTNRRVADMYCISLKDEECYPVFPKSYEEVEKLLYD